MARPTGLDGGYAASSSVDSSLRSSPLRGACGVQTGKAGLSLLRLSRDYVALGANL